jgi:hypothetical protein
MTAGWKEVFRKTTEYADQLGLELGIAASPRLSETGGPWVKADNGMKKMSWSVTHVHGGQRFTGTVPKPPTTTRIFQTSTAGWRLGGRAPGQNPPEYYYADQKVLAFRVPDDAILPVPVITASGGNLNAAALSDDLQNAAIELPAASEPGLSWIQFDYGRPVTIRGFMFSTSPAGG